MEIIEVALNDLLKHKSQPRFNDKEELEKLKNSITEFGVISPPIISPHPTKPSKYYIIAGHRRIKAMRELGYISIKAILSNRDSKDAIAPLAENIVKKDLSFIEMALAIYKIKEKYSDLTQREISRMLGKAENFISIACRVGSLDQEIIDKIYEYKKYKFANNQKICNRIVSLRKIRSKLIAIKMIEKLKKKEEEDGFSQSIFYQILTKEIELSKILKEKMAGRALSDEYEDEQDEQDEELNNIEQKTQKDEDDPFKNFIEEDNDFISEEIEENSTDTININTTKGDGYVLKHDQDWSSIELFIDINNISFNSSRDLQNVLKKIEEKVR